MKRNPELAHRVSNMPEIVNLRHMAVDKITALSMAIQQLSRATTKELSPTDEIAIEEKISDLLSEASYHWSRYHKVKMSTYEYFLQDESNHKSDLLNEGSVMIDKHIQDLERLKEQREGIN
jgi:hypothetical protein